MNKWDLLLEEALKNKTINLNQFVKRCCFGLKVDPQEVINKFLSSEDEQDIINGFLSFEMVRLSIELWLANGKPHYSGKKEISPESSTAIFKRDIVARCPCGYISPFCLCD